MRGAVHDPNAMTLTIKNSTEPNSPGKPGAPSQNSENNPGQNPRSNPVCLEVSVTIRSLPTEAGGLTQPIREEGRTVIVFDNGAVLRTANNLPVGLTVILSNSSGRDVVCRVVGGRNLPNVKGYIEVEFIEPIKDFWGIHQDPNSVTVAAPPVTPLAPRETPVPPPAALPAAPPAAPPRAVALPEPPVKPASVSLGSGPTFEDIPGLLSVPSSPVAREPKAQSARPGPEKIAKDDSNYNLSEIAQPTSVANWRSAAPEPPAEKRAIPATRDASPITSPASVPSHDFMEKGLLAYERLQSAPNESSGHMPFILGVAAVVLAGICAVVFYVHRSAAPDSAEKTDVVSQPTMPETSAAKNPPQHVQSPKEESAQVAPQTKAQAQAQPIAVDQAQPAAAVAPIPAVVTSTVTTNTRTEAGNVRPQAENAIVTNQPSPSPSRRSAIPNLKMSSPSAPNKNTSNLGEGAAPMTDIASTEAVGGTPPGGLLMSAGRTSNAPAPPPSAPAPAPVVAAKTTRDPKLISSPRLAYPTAARQANIQGSVTVSASIDENGKVVSAKALSGPMLLRQAAVESVSQWKYSPGLVEGKPAPSQVTVNVDFRLN
jgi:TonB family protein